MGVYFIAAGTSSSKNRYKTLEKWHSFAEIKQFLSPAHIEELRRHFSENDKIYLWGANRLKELSQVREGEYVVDVKNKKVIQAFKFCFFVETNNTRLQEFLRWDQEKPKDERRPYPFVYFLKSPIPTQRIEKKFFQEAFNLTSNQNWLVGQKYFNDNEINSALKRTSCASVESFLGISKDCDASPPIVNPPITPEQPTIIRRPKPEPAFIPPSWLAGLVKRVEVLKKDQGHLERDHEDLVASLFELLGYERTHDIKFRRGNIDIKIEKDNKPIITIEVKANWALSPKSRDALNQAYSYALEAGTPFVIITNGDRYCVYDRRKGLSYNENLVIDFRLTDLNEPSIQCLNRLRKEEIN